MFIFVEQLKLKIMKKLIIILSVLFMSLNGFSQSSKDVTADMIINSIDSIRVIIHECYDYSINPYITKEKMVMVKSGIENIINLYYLDCCDYTSEQIKARYGLYCYDLGFYDMSIKAKGIDNSWEARKFICQSLRDLEKELFKWWEYELLFE